MAANFNHRLPVCHLLNPHPGSLKLSPDHLTGIFGLDHQHTAFQPNPLTIERVPGIDHKRYADGQQFQRREGQNQHRALEPAKSANGQRSNCYQCETRSKLPRRH